MPLLVVSLYTFPLFPLKAGALPYKTRGNHEVSDSGSTTWTAIRKFGVSCPQRHNEVSDGSLVSSSQVG